MELDRIKDNWNAWGESLKRKELLNERMIRKIIEKKRDNAISRLINYIIRVIVFFVISMLSCILIWSTPILRNRIEQWFLWECGVILLVGIILLIRELQFLYKIDVVKKDMKELALLMNNYKRKKQKGWIYTPFIGFAYAYSFIASLKLFNDVAYSLIVITVVVGMLFTLFITWVLYRRVLLKNIEEIEESVTEWEEIEQG
ncbi:hypothetical protein [uncultured Sanguibacteroides sp.]|uniref:hypothetical protein n=1 Tax=uncultured Sanguibacteroides sp. TaxID=1635151 RepID=UPI0025F6C8AC|nr:hypothetical protein [uncultured Sanguibacteroides sp.]